LIDDALACCAAAATDPLAPVDEGWAPVPLVVAVVSDPEEALAVTEAVLELEEPQALAASANAIAVTASAAGLVQSSGTRRARRRAG